MNKYNEIVQNANNEDSQGSSINYDEVACILLEEAKQISSKKSHGIKATDQRKGGNIPAANEIFEDFDTPENTKDSTSKTGGAEINKANHKQNFRIKKHRDVPIRKNGEEKNNSNPQGLNRDDNRFRTATNEFNLASNQDFMSSNPDMSIGQVRKMQRPKARKTNHVNPSLEQNLINKYSNLYHQKEAYRHSSMKPRVIENNFVGNAPYAPTENRDKSVESRSTNR